MCVAGWTAGVIVVVMTGVPATAAPGGGAGTAWVLPAPGTSRVSVSTTGAQGNDESLGTGLSADARFVAFSSEASNLVPGDTNGEGDAFVRDRWAGTTTRVSVSGTGAQGAGESSVTHMTPDGRYIAFLSYASNLVPGDTNGASDSFVRDRRTGSTSRVSLSTSGAQTNNNGGFPVMSADGRYVAFYSSASNLVAGDTNNVDDIFIRDRSAGTTRRVSVSGRGAQANNRSDAVAISGNGRYVAYLSQASNLVAGDTNGESDVFLWDRTVGTTRRVSVSSGGAQANDRSDDVAISDDGRYLAFTSTASNLAPGDANGAQQDVFVRDLIAGTTSKVTTVQGSGADISGDGRYVAYISFAAGIVPDDTNDAYDVFLHDRQLGTTRRVSVSSSGAQGDGPNFHTSISADGRTVSFCSRATDLVPGDTNDTWDVFTQTPRLPLPHRL
jgi:hypothetical protein